MTSMGGAFMAQMGGGVSYCFLGEMHKQNGLQESIFSGHWDSFEVEVSDTGYLI